MRPLIPLLLLACTGCTVGPAYKRPAGPAAQGAWVAQLGQDQVANRWWAALGDAKLDMLVKRGLAANFDIREAQARLFEARANRDAAAGKAYPEIRATGSATEQQVSENGQIPINRIPGFTRQYSLLDLGFDASWEIDLWGGTRRSVEAADARSRQAAARLADVRLQTIAEIVRNYGDLRAAQARGKLLRDELAVRGEIESLVALRFKAGESARLELETAQQRTAAARAAVPDADAAATAAAYRLALLTGQPPEALTSLIAEPGALPSAPDLVAGGIRSDLLKRRPDIAAAEADLIAANEDVGVQTAQLYPRFSLMGSIGQQARRADDLTSGASTRFSIGPSFSWPIFSFGRIRAQIRAADARTNQALARYEKAVFGALSDSEAAANRFGTTGATLADRRTALARSREGASLARLRFERGEDDRIQMLEARSTSIAAAQQEAAAAADRLSAFVSLSKALAGGTGG